METIDLNLEKAYECSFSDSPLWTIESCYNRLNIVQEDIGHISENNTSLAVDPKNV